MAIYFRPWSKWSIPILVRTWIHARTRTIFDLVKPPRDVYGLASKFKYSQIKVRMRRSNRSQRPYNLRVYASASKHHSAPMWCAVGWALKFLILPVFRTRTFWICIPLETIQNLFYVEVMHSHSYVSKRVNYPQAKNTF